MADVLVVLDANGVCQLRVPPRLDLGPDDTVVFDRQVDVISSHNEASCAIHSNRLIETVAAEVLDDVEV